MRQIGTWLKTYGDSIYGTRGGPWQPVDDVYGSTWKGNTIYLHILDPKAFQREILPKLENEIEEAALFDGTAVAVEERPEGIRITLPERLNRETGDGGTGCYREAEDETRGEGGRG